MPSDYFAIAEENSRKYGTDIDRYGPVLLAHLYSDRTHFIYELLQNAEDAEATSIHFRLLPDRLEVTHDGRPFNTDDVRGICGLVEGTKKDDLNKVGKFGIGFKSVYAYTDSPEVHSGDESFRIEQYVHPFALDSHHDIGEKTLFIFPFNRDDVPAESAFSEVGSRLVELDSSTLLFLRNLNEISWEADSRNGYYVRSQDMLGAARHVVLEELEELEGDSKTKKEHWLVFQRGIDNGQDDNLTVEISFRLDGDDTESYKVVPAVASTLVAFFPTEKETHLGFVIQGPYRTTPARDNIPKDEPWNHKLIQETSLLLSDALSQLKTMGMLTVSCIEALPIKSSNFAEGGMFRPIFENTRSMLKSEALLPAYDGGFTSATNALLARGSQLRELLTPSQLRVLYQEEHEVTWLSDEISIDRTPELRGYLIQELNVSEIDPEDFARQIHVEFLSQQSDEWMIEFYAFLDGQRALWKSSGLRPVLHTKPYIRLENGDYVPPFRDDGTPNVYLPSSESSAFQVVKARIASDPVARDFLLHLGLEEPDIVAEVMDIVLTKYCGQGRRRVGTDENMGDISKIIQALGGKDSVRRNLLSKVQETPFLRAFNMTTRATKFMSPVQLYFRTPNLELYFRGNADAWFLCKGYEEFHSQLAEMGVARYTRVFERSEDHGFVYPRRRYYGSHIRGLNGFNFECEIDGLQYAVLHPDADRSAYLWNELLMPNSKSIAGEVERCTRQDFSGANRSREFSSMGKLSHGYPWLPTKSGEFHKPEELSLDDLPDGFQRDEILAKQLGMKSTSLNELAKESGLDLDILMLAQKHPDAFRKFAEELEAKELGVESSDGMLLNYENELRDRFGSRDNGGTQSDHDEVEEDVVTDPAGRRERVSSEISQRREAEPSLGQRVDFGYSKHWECKNTETREFLRQQYDGRCQICGEAFRKRNGEPYFEAFYLVSRIKASWVDRLGNVVCLCPTCCAKMMHGVAEIDGFIDQVEAFRARNEGGGVNPSISMKLCGERVVIRYSEKHMLDLQELIRNSRSESQDD